MAKTYIDSCAEFAGFTPSERAKTIAFARQTKWGNTTAPEAAEWMPTQAEFAIANLNLLEKETAMAYRMKKNMSVTRMIWKKVAAHPKGIGKGLQALISYDNTEHGLGIPSLEQTMHSIAAHAMARMEPAMRELQPHMGIMLRRENQAKFVKAIYGGSGISPEYAAFAKAYNDIIDEFSDRFRLAEGKKPEDSRPGKRDQGDKTWQEASRADRYNAKYLPIIHNQGKMANMGFEKWYEMITKEFSLDFVAMGIRNSDNKVRMRQFFDSVVTDGISSSHEMEINSLGGLNHRMNRAKFLVFKTADDYIKYTDMLSPHTPYSAMMDQIKMMGHEIAQMEVLGPMPGRTWDELERAANISVGELKVSTHEASIEEGGFLGLKKRLGNAKKQHRKKVKKMTRDIQLAKAAHEYLTGKLAPVDSDLADSMQAVRNLYSGMRLGGSTLTALPDAVFLGITAQYNGINAFRMWGTFVRELANVKKGQDSVAADMWFPLTHAIDSVHAAARYGETYGRDLSARFAEFTMRASILNHWTVAAKRAFHIEFMNMLVAEPNSSSLKTLARYGITDAEAKQIRASKKTFDNGYTGPDFKQLDTALAEKIAGAAISESKYAVPEANAIVQAMMTQGTRRGTGVGEGIRYGGQFKTFAVTVMMLHWSRTFKTDRAIGTKMMYGSSLIVGTTALGAAAVQLKALVAGEDMREANTFEFWRDALLAGGAGSIAFDLIFGEDYGAPGASAFDVFGPAAGDVMAVVYEGILVAMAKSNSDVLGIKSKYSRKDWDELLLKAGGEQIASHLPKYWLHKLFMEANITAEMRRAADNKFVDVITKPHEEIRRATNPDFDKEEAKRKRNKAKKRRKETEIFK